MADKFSFRNMYFIGMCVDPSPGTRWLFWTDWGENPRVERIGMDGTNRSTIISTKIYWPNGLTLDTANKRVYFADSKLDYIDFCYYNGTGRQQVISGSHYLLHPHSLTLFEDTMYWTDRQLNRVLSAHKFKGTNQTVVSHLISQPLSIHVHHPSLQPIGDNPCQNEPCQQLCLLSPSTASGYTCKCRPGFRVTSDGRCIAEETTFLMVMKGSQIVDVSLTPDDKSTGFLTPVVGLDSGIQIDYDRKKETLFWVQGKQDDDENCTIFTTPYGGGNRTEFLGSDTGVVGAPYAIAFDWLGRNLFIGNRLASNFEVIRVDGKTKHRSVILANDGNRTSVGKPKAMCIDPLDGKLYWTDDGSFNVPSKIGKVNMDGSNPIVLLEINQPLAITIDIEKKLIYYSTQFPAIIASIDTEGNNQHTIIHKDDAINTPIALGVLDSRLFYMDPTYEKLVRIDLPNGDNPKNILENENELKTFTVFKKRQIIEHPCVINSGGCEQICIPAAERTRVCACSVGYKKENEVNCVPYKTFAVVSQLDMTRGFSLKDSADAMVPITGPGMYKNIFLLETIHNTGMVATHIASTNVISDFH